MSTKGCQHPDGPPCIKVLSNEYWWNKYNTLPSSEYYPDLYHPLSPRLLHDQTGVVDFAPFRSLFMAHFARSRTSYEAMPAGAPSLYGYPQSNWKEAGPKNGLPAVGARLNDLVGALQVIK